MKTTSSGTLSDRILDVRNVALCVWLLAWCGISAAYLASAQGGHVDWCVPHLTGCDSVSATGRHGWGFFIFKATMLPAAGLMLVYWSLCYQWLRRLGPRSAIDGWVLFLGLSASLALVLYVTFLGSVGDVYRALRRYGTVVYFGGTYLAQLLLIKRIRDAGIDPPLAHFMQLVAVFMFVGGLLFGTLANFFEDDDFLQNISEWNFGSALTAFPLLTWFAWRRSGFELRWSLARRSDTGFAADGELQAADTGPVDQRLGQVDVDDAIARRAD